MRGPLEKAVGVAGLGDGPALEGIFLRAADGSDRAAALVAAPHPLYGGSMENPVVSELALAACDAGRASLRFNWRGVGASAGGPSGEPADADADLAAALAHLAESVPGPLALCGYSFGAAAAVRVAAVRSARGAERVDRLVLVAPPPALLDAADLRALALPLLVLAGQRDRIAPPPGIAALLEGLPAARLQTVPDADHFFAAGLAAVGRRARPFLAPAEPGPA